MNIQPLSDLHMEMIKNTFSIPATDADVIVLAGDINLGTKGVEWANTEAARLQKPIIYVAGNHEHYKEDYYTNVMAMRAAAGDNVYFLEQEEVLLNGVRFLGATLWSDYMATGQHDQYQNMQKVAILDDYRLIRFGSLYKFRPEDALAIHKKTVSWLKVKLTDGFDGQTVVVTHHGPSLNCVHPAHGINAISSCFFSDLDDLVEKADLWVYGHTHSNLDTKIGKCRLLSNQKEYPEAIPSVGDFQADKVVSL
ncbi:metallophosphoesterase [Methylophaga sp. OBS3]|uniref:metallophosphoesterase n=1 Tax=Methylophaga sp. OBS3 TaxID=2991934 RepID=UPI002252B525|nr:metallophosphoesterase [Methylophaga sp. OBS3]MCX4190279.1 metallophosphoesterase [Methylophaga sp. OBS3]